MKVNNFAFNLLLEIEPTSPVLNSIKAKIEAFYILHDGQAVNFAHGFSTITAQETKTWTKIEFDITEVGTSIMETTNISSEDFDNAVVATAMKLGNWSMSEGLYDTVLIECVPDYLVHKESKFFYKLFGNSYRIPKQVLKTLPINIL